MNALATAETFAEGLEGFLEVRRDRSPTDLVWPPTLPIELALKTAPPNELRIEYDFTPVEWENLRYNPVFLRDLKDACELVRQEGMGFKLKAKLQAEELLKTSWRLIHAPSDEVSAAVKADLIKATARWAGYENKAGDNNGPVQANMLNIQINLGDDR